MRKNKPGAGRPRKQAGAQRVTLAVRVLPQTKSELLAMREQLKVSLGELIDKLTSGEIIPDYAATVASAKSLV